MVFPPLLEIAREVTSAAIPSSDGPYGSLVRYDGDNYVQMLKVDYLVLADAAAAADGKHYIHGAGWEYLYVASFPVSHPMISVAIRLRIPWTDTNYPHNLELDVVDADGQSILPQPPGPIRGPITVGRPPAIEVGADQVACLVINVMGLEFTRRGAYAVVLRIEGIDASRAPFRVELHPAMMGETPPQG